MRVLVFLLVLLLAPAARGEDIVLEPIPPGDDVIVPLRKGAVAPFEGQLFDTNTAIRWGVWLQQYKARIDLEVGRAKGVCAAEVDYKDAVFDIEVERSAQITQDLTRRLLTAEKRAVKAEGERDNPAWYKSPWFGLTVGVVSTTALVILGSQAF